MTALVLKLGGSLAESGRLRAVLALVRRAHRPVVVVPGGGPFADAVRQSQADLGFSDAAAHDMAILAMHQMAQTMIAIEPRLVAADTLVGMALAWRKQRIPVWLPAKLCAGDQRIPRDWSITSDGLAARLAERLGGVDLVVVKSCTVKRTASAATLARQGVVDPTFAAIVARANLAWRIVGPGGEAELASLLEAACVEPACPSSRRALRTAPRSIRARRA